MNRYCLKTLFLLLKLTNCFRRKFPLMGQQSAEQNSLFYDFSLEQHIPENYLLRRIDSFLDFDQLRYHLFPYYSLNGRPSIDPELMIRMLLIGYCYGIRSERRICEEVNYNLAYRWFCRLGLQGEIPSHSTFSKNRLGRFRESEVFRFVFNTVVSRCIDEGLVKGEGFAIDASFVRADVSRQRAEDGPVDWSPSPEQSRPVREYLEALDDVPSLRRPQKSVSLTDPMSQWSGAKGPAEFYYSTNYLIDVENGVIMDVEGSPSTLALEVATTKTMIERVEDNHDIVPARLMGDTAYGSAENLGYLVTEKKIEPHIPVWDKSKRDDDTYSIKDFIYIDENDHYICPEGKFVQCNRGNLEAPRVTKDNTIIYRGFVGDCKNCPSKERCCPNTTHRKIARNIHEEARELARAIGKLPEYIESSKERKKVEMSFAHMKRHREFDRLRLRGLKGANDEFLLMATAQNLRKMVNIKYKPPPDDRESAPEIQNCTDFDHPINLLTSIKRQVRKILKN